MVSAMTVSSATRKQEAARALAPTICAWTEGTEARHGLSSQLFETIADAGFLHSSLDRRRGLVWTNPGFRDGQRARQ